jgi:N-acetylglutamate synthase-like GNAT family acetyltransferase
MNPITMTSLTSASSPQPLVPLESGKDLEISPFPAASGEAVIALILPIQQEEFGIAVTLDDQPDLLDIAAFYQRGNGNFWVAQAQGAVVGTIALLDIGHGRVALRKMFVASAYRGAAFGVARRLLDTLLQWSIAQGVSEIFLGTTAQFLAAHRFYEKHGFVPLEKAQLPAEFPVMKVDSRFYVYRFEQASAS